MTVYKIITFIIGPITPTLITAIFFCLGASGARLVQQGFKKEVLSKIFKRILSYFFFLMIANRLDSMGVNTLFGWQGTTQLLVAVWIAVTEVREIITIIKQFGEIELPPIMEDRLNQMEQGKVNPNSGYIDQHSLDEQIKYLMENMEKLKQLSQLQNQVNNYTDNTSVNCNNQNTTGPNSNPTI